MGHDFHEHSYGTIHLIFIITSLPPAPPPAPKDLSAEEVTECSATLTWKAPSDDDELVDEYIVEMRKRSGSESDDEYREVRRLPRSRLSTIIEELEEDEEYDFIVRAVNKAGASKDVAQLEGGIKTKKKLGMWLCSSRSLGVSLLRSVQRASCSTCFTNLKLIQLI